MKLDKKTLMPSIVLTVICLIVALLLAGVNLITKDTIAENEKKAIEDSLCKALDAKYGENLLSEKVEIADHKVVISDIYEAKSKNTGEENVVIGYAVVMSVTSRYSKGAMNITLGVNKDGTVANTVIVSYKETKNFSQKENYPDKFKGKDLDGAKEVSTVSSVTYSSKAFRYAVTDALQLLSDMKLTGQAN